MYIKLPRKKVRYACALLLMQHDDYIARLSRHHSEDMVRWGDKKSCVEVMPARPDLSRLGKARDLMDDMVDMCDHSKGDVFVSPQLWETIRRYYKK